MKPIVVDANNNLNIPAAWLEHSKKLYSQDFITSKEMLSHNNDYATNLYGTTIISPGYHVSGGEIKSSGVNFTGEFKWDNLIASSVPLWYKYSILQPVDVVETEVRSASLTTEVGAGTATLTNLINKDGFYIVRNSIELTIGTSIQQVTSFYTNYGEEYITLDISDIDTVALDINVSYTIAKLGIELDIDKSTNYSMQIYSHYEDTAIVVMMFETFVTGTIQYTLNSVDQTEYLTLVNLYTKVADGMVAPNTFTYSYNGEVKFPLTFTFALFAIQPLSTKYTSIMHADVKTGLSINAPWFINLNGSFNEVVPVKEYENIQPKIIMHKEETQMINMDEFAVINDNIIWHGNPDSTISGIDVYFVDKPEALLDVKTYNKNTKIVTLSKRIPVGTHIICEYKEISYSIEYKYLQVNPSVNFDDDLYNNYVLLYLDLNEPEVGRNIYHMLLPKIVNGEIINYTYAVILAALQTAYPGPDILPFMFFIINEPIDSDFYTIFDFTTRGGYNISSKTVTDSIYWDGEDVDISGNVYATVPSALIDQLAEHILEWSEETDINIARDNAKIEIEEHIQNTKRLGMNVTIEME